MSRFRNGGYDQGISYVKVKVNSRKYQYLEDIIFEAMAANPCKSEKARNNFVQGVCDMVNFLACQRNNMMNEKRG